MEYDLTALDESKDICEHCAMFKNFGDKCWFFWKYKKECSQRVHAP